MHESSKPFALSDLSLTSQRLVRELPKRQDAREKAMEASDACRPTKESLDLLAEAFRDYAANNTCETAHILHSRVIKSATMMRALLAIADQLTTLHVIHDTKHLEGTQDEVDETIKMASMMHRKSVDREEGARRELLGFSGDPAAMIARLLNELFK